MSITLVLCRHGGRGDDCAVIIVVSLQIHERVVLTLQIHERVVNKKDHQHLLMVFIVCIVLMYTLGLYSLHSANVHFRSI